MTFASTSADRAARPFASLLDWLSAGLNFPLLVVGVVIAIYTLAFGTPYSFYVMAIAGSYALLVIGFQFIFGHAGAVSLAQAAFFGMGAYVSGLLGMKLGWSFHATFPLAILAPALLAIVVATPVLKLQEHYFALATLGLSLVALLIATQWVSMTGGMNGLSGVPNFVVFGYEISQRLHKLIFVWCLVATGALLSHQLMRGLYGLEYRIARANSTAAMSVGINVSTLRFTAFVLSAAFAGAAGALMAHLIRVVSPQNLEFSVMITCLTITVIGGRVSIAGGILAAILLVHLPEWFRVLQDYRLIAYGAVTLVMVIIAPEGIIGGLEAVRKRFIPERSSRLPPRQLHAMRRQNETIDESSLLTVQGLSKSFGGVQAIKEVHLELKRGEIFGLIGPNGSGKTTLLNVISGVYMPDRGRVLFTGRDITRMPPYAISRMGLARTFQNINLVGDMTALDNVTVARASLMNVGLWSSLATVGADRSLAEAREHAMSLLDAVGAAEIAGQRCDRLSYGTKRRVEIARALAVEPNLLLLDEPAAGLNEAEQVELGARLRDFSKRGLTLFIIEHNMRFLLPLAHRMSCLDHGEIIASGTPDRIVTVPAVVEAYLGKADKVAV
jgi:branched-chain amino acid transport system permease protein